jgi:molybdopterin synthase sulfur carrier subunit
MARVILPSALEAWTRGQREIEVTSVATVRDALDALERAHPGVAARLLDRGGRLQPFLRVFVGAHDIASLAGLDTPVGPSDEIEIVAAIAGGAG